MIADRKSETYKSWIDRGFVEHITALAVSRDLRVEFRLLRRGLHPARLLAQPVVDRAQPRLFLMRQHHAAAGGGMRRKPRAELQIAYESGVGERTREIDAMP